MQEKYSRSGDVCWQCSSCPFFPVPAGTPTQTLLVAIDLSVLKLRCSAMLIFDPGDLCQRYSDSQRFCVCLQGLTPRSSSLSPPAERDHARLENSHGQGISCRVRAGTAYSPSMCINARRPSPSVHCLYAYDDESTYLHKSMRHLPSAESLVTYV